jgi:preprotein translocase subunit SecD
MAIEAGYNNAMSSVVDSNLTTLIAGLILFQFGTGPIKGFAVTLCVGILTSMFTALTVCRWIQEWLVNNRKIERISI